MLLACTKQSRIPDDVLSKEEMVKLLLDIYMAESKVNNLKLTRDSSLAIFKVYEHKLLDKYSISDSVYRRTVTYYYSHPTHLEEIYGHVLDSLQLREQKLNEKNNASGKPTLRIEDKN